ncbi:MAG: acetyl ornithine aminotransferase family protein [Aggregatilineales bacterium]
MATYTFREPSAKARTYVERDEKALSPSYTRSYGFVMAKGEGAEVWDVDGNHYLDIAAGIAVLSTGHRHPKIVEAIKNQVEKYIHIGATDFFCPEQLNLAERLQQIIKINGVEDPGDVMTYFGNSGTEAIEAALKLARYQEPKRNHIIAFYGSFHGRTMGALSVTASKPTQRADYSYIPGGVEHIPYPGKFATMLEGTSAATYDPIEYMEYFILGKKVPADEIAAVLVEPIQGEGGYIVPRDDFFPKLRDFCDRHGILMIVDEIQSGVGRTGKWLAVEHWGVKPDIVCLAKGLGSGMPIGAIVTSRDIMGKWISGAHASTFGGNPLACAVASATLDVIEGEGLLDHARELGNYVIERMSAFQKDHPSLRRVEGKGLMIGVEFQQPDGTEAKKFRNHVVDQAFLNGLLTLGCGASTLRIAPPLVITREQMEQSLDILERVIAQAEEEVWEH